MLSQRERLVKLVDANDPTICQDHRARLTGVGVYTPNEIHDSWDKHSISIVVYCKNGITMGITMVNS